jgi:PKD repeat protein
VVFVHTAVAGDAFLLTIFSGNDQTAEAGTLLPAELVARLIDSEGNGVPNTAVTWVPAIGGGSANPVNTVTDGDGRTATQWTLGPALGGQRMDAVVSGVSVVSFTATATAGAPASLFIRTQPSGSARNGIPLDRQPVVQLRDPQGNDVAAAGVEVTVSLNGGGELEGTTRVATDASGRATFTDLAISGDPGTRTLVFQAVGYAAVTSDEITVAAIGTSTTITSDLPDPSQVGTAFTVTFRVASDGPTPTGTVIVSDGVDSCDGPLSNGAGSCTLSLSTVGARTLTATYSGTSGLTGSSDTEVHTVTAAPPPPPAGTTTTITSDQPDPSVSGSTVTLSVQVTSAAGTPTGNVTVSVSGGSATCNIALSGGQGSCELRLDAVGERTFTATYQGGPGFAGSSDTEAHRVDAQAPDNDAPFADYNWVCNGLTCQFTDASRDSDGRVVGWSWTFGDGGTSPEQNPSHTFAAAGTYTVTLTATDDDGGADPSTASVRVQAPPPDNQPPTAAFTTECDELECDFDNDSDDPDGRIATFAWEFGDGGTSSERNPDHEYAAGGTYTVRLTVTDDDGATGTITQDVTVAEEAASTSTRFEVDTPDPTVPGEVFTVRLSVRSNDGTPEGTATVSDGVDGCTITIAGGSGSCTLALTTVGDRTLTATFQGNADFATSSAEEDHRVNPAPPANEAPSANDDAASTAPGTPVTIPVRANDTDPEGATLSIINVSDPPNGTAVNNGDGTITYTPDAGFGGATDVFTYSASDGSLSDEATVTVAIDPVQSENQAPNAVIGSISCTGMTCTFTDASTDPDGEDTIAEWSWIFGDGETSTDRNPVHAYSAPDEYDVELRVTDDGGLSDTVSQQVTVAVEGGGEGEG